MKAHYNLFGHLEIKWNNRYEEKPSELKSLIAFSNSNTLKSALATTIDVKTQKEFQGVVLQYVPCASYAYNVGKNSLYKKRVNDVEKLYYITIY